jgi:hypothetical protein
LCAACGNNTAVSFNPLASDLGTLLLGPFVVPIRLCPISTIAIEHHRRFRARLSSTKSPTTHQASDDREVTACKSTGLLALQEKSKDISDLVIDMESVAVSKADTNVEDVAIKTVVLGEAHIARNGKTETPDRFVCLLGEKGKVL